MSNLKYENYWQIEQYSITAHLLRLSGWIVFPEGENTVAVYANGVLAKTVKKHINITCDQLFEFLPAYRRSGFTAEFFIKENFTGYMKIEINYEMYVPANNTPLLPRYIFIGQSLEIIPSDKQLHRIAGSTANAQQYLNVGYTEAKRLIWISQQHGMDFEKQALKILDWGCGCGRVSRQLQKLVPIGSYINGIDIDEENIIWCQNFLDGDYFKVSLHPPTEFTDEAYDAVVSSSVASHLKRDILDQWLTELSRILRPNGIVIISFLGSESAYLHLKNQPPIMSQFLDHHYSDTLECHDLSGIISDDEYYRNTFFDNNEFLKENNNFIREAIYLSTAQGFQHYAVLRKTCS